MKTVMLSILFLTFGLFNQSLYAKDDSALVSGYLKIQEALVADDFESAKKAAQTLSKSSEIKREPALHKEVKQLVSSKSIDEIRKEFKDVSSALIDEKKSEFGKDIIVVYCPMAGAKWIQKAGEIANPYMGKKMATCGEKI